MTVSKNALAYSALPSMKPKESLIILAPELFVNRQNVERAEAWSRQRSRFKNAERALQVSRHFRHFIKMPSFFLPDI